MKQMRHSTNERGATSVQVLVLLVPVFFGFMGFAIDLGRLYLARGEVKSAANAMALAAAARLIGTEASVSTASASARLAIDNAGGFGNKYDFGRIVIGEGTGFLTSDTPEPEFFGDVASATGEGEAAVSEAGSGAARHVRVDVRADAPLIFWSFLSLGQSRKVQVAARAVAGMSAPVCTACGVEPIAVPALDPSDTANFGYVASQRYTLGYVCSGNPQPSGLAGATQRIPYLLLNRLNEEATLFPDETSQAYRIGAGGLPGSSNRTRACLQIGSPELMWATAAPTPCMQNRVPQTTTAFVCGLASRFETSLPAACENVPAAADILSAHAPDSDLTSLDDYAAYTGNTRRVITVAIVDALSASAEMTILGFRQFLVQPNLNDITISPGDNNARFQVSYIGSPVPLKQGYFGACGVSSGPGKVVLHQ